MFKFLFEHPFYNVMMQVLAYHAPEHAASRAEH